ncbi:MAG: hypothetical protein IH946_10020 [Bacteroidetes bacterium]|nr:hypothetical protein [Bacteroidota bacterium]
MRLVLLTFGLVISGLVSTIAQPWEIGGWIGGALYSGDLNTTRDFSYTRPALGITARHNYNHYLSIRPFINFAMIAATDVGSKNPFEAARGLDFRSNIFEVGAQLEFNFIKYYPGDDEFYFSPYTFIGFALFYFSPKGSYAGFPPQPLDFYGTEGQELPNYPDRKQYALIQPAIPIGVGIKYGINYFWNFAFEIGQRKTFFDYLDDVSTTYADNSLLQSERGPVSAGLADKSGQGADVPQIGIEGKQRGNSMNNDNYMFIAISLTYTLRSIRCPPPSRNF